MSYSRWTRLWIATSAAFLALGGIVWILKLAVVVATDDRVVYTGAAETFFDLGLVLLLVGSTPMGLRLTANDEAMSRVGGASLCLGFGLWLVSLTALYARYAPLSGGRGRTGLGMSIAGIVLLAVGHPFSFITGLDLLGLIVLGVLALAIGPLLFGLACWPTLAYGGVARPVEVLPRRWRFVPLFTGLPGLAWFGNSGETAFFLFRTLFAAGRLLIGYVLFSDAETPAKRLTIAREVWRRGSGLSEKSR